MLSNYLKIAFRNIQRQKFYSAINILGLAIGLAICLLILLFVKDELSYDQHHSKADRIYRALMVWGLQGDDPRQAPIGPYRLQPALKTDFPEVEQIVRISPTNNTLVQIGEKEYQESHFFFADAEIFEVFDFELLQGDKETALTEPFTVVLSESIAQKYFGAANPIGKTLKADNRLEVKVTGVYKDSPESTHFTADALVSMKTGETVFNQLVLNNWGEGSCYTYLLLGEQENSDDLAAKFPAFIEKNGGEGMSKSMGIALQKMTDIHLYSNLRGEIQANSDIRYIYISISIALFILLLACINYMNLATARSVKRALEIGVRKTLGAGRYTLAGQFLSESVMIAALALVLGFGLAALSLSSFNAFVEKGLSLNPFQNPDVFALFLGITLLVGLIAGSYPAFYLSSFDAIQVLKERFTKGSSGMFRKVLVVFQFAISILLILATIVVYQQWDYMRHKDLGLNKENLVMVPIPDLEQYQALKNQLLANPNVLEVGASNKRLTSRLSSNLGFKAEQYEPDPNRGSSIKIVTNDHDFLKTLEVDFKEGRNFSRDFVSDDTSAFILNEAAVKMIGWEKPIGKWFETSEFNDGSWATRRGKIVGVIKDYNHESLHSAIEPAVYYISKTWLNWMTIRIAENNTLATMSHIKDQWTKFASPELYTYNFMDDRIDQMYRTEERFFNIFTFFAMLAIFIAGLGILGLSAFMAERRTKEIGIRKIFGASTGNLVYLLTKEFSVLVLIGFVLAAPLGYYFLNDWLADFTYRTSIGWLPFVGAGLLALVMAWGTSGFQSLKAALLNPILALRHD